MGVPIEFRTDLPGDGLLVDWPGPRARILLKQLGSAHSTAQRRQLFTLAHELGHIVLRHELKGFWNEHDYKLGDPNEERLCNAFAGELLLPSSHLCDDLKRSGISPSALLALANRYQVNITALIRAVAQKAGAKRFLAILWSSKSGGPTPTWGTPCQHRDVVLVDTGRTTVELAFQTSDEFKGRDQLIVAGKRESWDCVSQAVGRTKVLTVGRRIDCAYRFHTSIDRQLSLFDTKLKKINEGTRPQSHLDQGKPFG